MIKGPRRYSGSISGTPGRRGRGLFHALVADKCGIDTITAPRQVSAALISSHEYLQPRVPITIRQSRPEKRQQPETAYFYSAFTASQLTTLIVLRICFAADHTSICEIFVERLFASGRCGVACSGQIISCCTLRGLSC